MFELTKLLIDLKFPKNSSRKNVLQEGDKTYTGFVLGYIRLMYGWGQKWGWSVQLSNNTFEKKYNKIYELSKDLAELYIPDFNYSTIQYNKNYKIAKHKDKRNAGISYIIALGDYEGGELLIYFDGRDKEPTPVDIKNKFYTFDGTKYYHEVADFTGNRISLVYYNIIHDKDIKKEDVVNASAVIDFIVDEPEEIIANNQILQPPDPKQLCIENYVIAIPTYQRYNELYKKTLPTLLNASVSPEKIYIFVANEEEYMLYKSKIPVDWYKEIIIGELGIRNQRKFISKYFEEGKCICSFDDDVEAILCKSSGDKLHKVNNIDRLIVNNFNLLQKTKEFEGIHLWGFYPTPNALWMKDSYLTTDLRSIIGVVHGYINRHDESLYPDELSETKEDLEQSILFYKKDKGILRFNNLSYKTKFLAPGGCGQDRFEEYKIAQEYLVKTYPEYCKAKFKKNGSPEVHLFKNPKINLL
jgi:hypothetical protein